MSDNFVAGASSGDPLRSVADALETAVQAAKDGAADARSAVDKALPAAQSLFVAVCLHHQLHAFLRGCFSRGPDRQVNSVEQCARPRIDRRRTGRE